MAATATAAGERCWSRYTDYSGTDAAFIAAEAVLILAACLLFFTSLPQQWLLQRRHRRDAAAAAGGHGVKSKSGWRPLPEVRGWPVAGLLRHFALHGFNAGVTELYRRHGAPGLLSFRIGFSRMLLVSSPEMVRAVLREQEEPFLGRPPTPLAVSKLSYLDHEIGFLDYGPDYRFRKRIILQHMLSSPRVAMFQRHRESEFSALVRALHYVCTDGGRAAGGQEQAITVRPFIRAAAVNALAATAMSQLLFHMPGEDGYSVQQQQQAGTGRQFAASKHDDLGDQAHLVPMLMTDSPGKTGLHHMVYLIASTFTIVDLFPSLAAYESLLLPGTKKRLERVFSDMDAFLQDAVDSRRRDYVNHQRRSELQNKNSTKNSTDIDGSQEPAPPPPQDVLDILLAFRDAENRPLSDGFIKSQMQLMVASVDTTTMVVEWTLAELLRHPDCLRKVQDEMDRVIGTQRPLEETDLPNLPYFKGVVKEAMRLHPTAPLLFPRRCTQDTEIGGYHVPADTVVLVNVCAMHLDPAVWPDPHAFLPDRFLNQTGSDYMGGHDHRLMPFGLGRRMCPGLHLGSRLIDLALAKLLHTFHLRLPGDLKPHDLCMTVAKGTIACMHQPLTAIFSPRLDRTHVGAAG